MALLAVLAEGLAVVGGEHDHVKRSGRAFQAARSGAERGIDGGDLAAVGIVAGVAPGADRTARGDRTDAPTRTRGPGCAASQARGGIDDVGRAPLGELVVNARRLSEPVVVVVEAAREPEPPRQREPADECRPCGGRRR